MKMKKSMVKILTVCFCVLTLVAAIAVPAAAAVHDTAADTKDLDEWEVPLWEWYIDVVDADGDFLPSRIEDAGIVLRGNGFRVEFATQGLVGEFPCPCGHCCTDGMYGGCPMDEQKYDWEDREIVYNIDTENPFWLQMSTNSNGDVTLRFGRIVVEGEYFTYDRSQLCGAFMEDLDDRGDWYANEEDFVYEEWEIVIPIDTDNDAVGEAYAYRWFAYWCSDCGGHSRAYHEYSIDSSFGVRISHNGEGVLYQTEGLVDQLGYTSLLERRSPLLDYLLSLNDSYSDGYQDGYNSGYQDGYSGAVDIFKESDEYEGALEDAWFDGYDQSTYDLKKAYLDEYIKYFPPVFDEYPLMLDRLLEANWRDVIVEDWRAFYDQGENDGHEIGWNEGHKIGLNDGANLGYETGKIDGYIEGYEEGYNIGFSESDVATNGFKDFAFAIFEAPSVLVGSMLDFDFLGINLYSLLKTLLTMAVIAAIVIVLIKFVM